MGMRGPLEQAGRAIRRVAEQDEHAVAYQVARRLVDRHGDPVAYAEGAAQAVTLDDKLRRRHSRRSERRRRDEWNRVLDLEVHDHERFGVEAAPFARLDVIFRVQRGNSPPTVQVHRGMRCLLTAHDTLERVGRSHHNSIKSGE